MLAHLAEIFLELISQIGYVGLAIAMFVENVFPPIPSEIILPTVGILAQEDKFNIYIAAIIAGFFSYLGTLPFFFIGSIGNYERLHNFIEKYGKYIFITNDDIKKGLDVFNKYGTIIVLFGRLIPVIRSIVSFPAGLYKMNFLKFSIYTIIGSTLWSFILIYIGYLVGAGGKENLLNILSKYEKGILVFLIVVIIGFVVYKLTRKKKSSLT